VARSLRRSDLSIETTSRRVASLRRSDLFATRASSHQAKTGNSYGVRTVNLLASIEQATPTEFDPQGSLRFDRRSRLGWSSEAQVVGTNVAILRLVLWQLFSATLQPALKRRWALRRMLAEQQSFDADVFVEAGPMYSIASPRLSED
jgi:hypothetical protein